MEVHHHPDLHHHKKKIKEYFLEFLMIFLAVTLGFLAENLREHIAEEHNATVFSRSLLADFTADTVQLHQLIAFTTTKNRNIDSLTICLHQTGSRYNDSVLYTKVLYLISTFQFDNIDGTYVEIKNSGFLKLFDQQLVDSLNSFDATSLKLKLMEDLENKFLLEKVNTQAETMFNYLAFDDLRAGKTIRNKLYLKNMDETSVDILINRAEFIKRLRERQLNQYNILLRKSKEIIVSLKQL